MRMLLAAWDGGDGHVVRIAHVARALQSAGHEVVILSSARKRRRTEELAPRVRVVTCECRPPARAEAVRVDPPVYSHAFAHAQRRMALGYGDPGFIASNVRALRAVVRSFRPARVVHDYHDTIRIAADAEGVPVVSVAIASGLRSGAPLGNWRRDELAGRRLPECLESFNECRALLGLEPYRDERETFEGALNLVPSSADLDPLAPRPQDMYVGPLIERPSARSTGRRRPLIVSYLAEGNGRPASEYIAALRRLVDRQTRTWDFAVFGGRRYADHFGAASPHSAYRGMVDPREFLETLARASVVITHGGTTLVHALARGTPVYCLPWTSSQAAWAVRAHDLGAGLLHEPYRAPLSWRPDPAVGDGVEVAGHWNLPITSGELEDSLRRLLDEPGFARAARDVGQRLTAVAADRELVSLIEATGAV